MLTEDFLDRFDSELVIGLVAPVGTEKAIIINELKDNLKAFDYDAIIIKLSGFLKEPNLQKVHNIQLSTEPEVLRINSYMDAGDKVREEMKRGDALALWAVTEIARLRPPEEQWGEKRAYILDSLKHPEEIKTLRRVYGNGFFLIGIYSSREKRFDFLHRNRNIEEEDAEALIDRDYNEDKPTNVGQQTREAFHVADAFVSLTNPSDAKHQISRVIDLFFGHPFTTPTMDEYAMFQAFTAKLRSADLSRQVGAVILSETGELIAVGANDVPCYGGGLYWPGDNDHRDYDWGIDSNAKRRDQILSDIVQLVRKKTSNNVDTDEKELLKEVREGLSHSILLDITEFGRPVHAEMEALLSCARIGVSPGMGTLYCTTFPCHTCAKHIVAAGIKRVVYVEPYPKSKAKELHSDSIEIDEESDDSDKVSFVPFVGVGARRFIDLFSMGLNSGYEMKRKKQGSIEKVDWKRESAKVRVPMLRTSYLEREKAAASIIAEFYRGEKDEKEAN
ncbi:MAG TPA: anti-phage dCTP deaminase [Pyrinomonadaceae bacterium]|jgi:deoxycytidylate deaminase